MWLPDLGRRRLVVGRELRRARDCPGVVLVSALSGSAASLMSRGILPVRPIEADDAKARERLLVIDEAAPPRQKHRQARHQVRRRGPACGTARELRLKRSQKLARRAPTFASYAAKRRKRAARSPRAWRIAGVDARRARAVGRAAGSRTCSAAKAASASAGSS